MTDKNKNQKASMGFTSTSQHKETEQRIDETTEVSSKSVAEEAPSSIEIQDIEDEEELIEILKQLKQEADRISKNMLQEDTEDEDGAIDILGGVLEKYDDEVGIRNPPRNVDVEEYGVINIAEKVEKMGELEYWIHKRANLGGQTNNDWVKETPIYKRFWLRFTSDYRTMGLHELVEEQARQIEILNSLLDKTMEKANAFRKDIYDRHKEIVRDAKEARIRKQEIEHHVQNLMEIKENSGKALSEIDPTTPEGFEIQELVLELRERAEPIREFSDNCARTVNWLWETEGSYQTFEDIMDGYMRMINNIRGRTANLLTYVDDFNNIAAGIKEGKDMTNELYKGIVSLTEGVYAGVGEIQKGIKDITGNYTSIEDLELPQYVNRCLSGPLTDIGKAEKRMKKSRFLSKVASSYRKN